MKKTLKVLSNIAYEAIAVIAMWFTLGAIYLIAEGDMDRLLKLNDWIDAAFIALVLGSIRFTIYDIITKIKKVFKK